MGFLLPIEKIETKLDFQFPLWDSEKCPLINQALQAYAFNSLYGILGNKQNYSQP